MSPAARVGHLEPAGLWAAPLLWGPGRAGSLCLRLLSRVSPLHSRALPSPAGLQGRGALSQGETPTHPPIGLTPGSAPLVGESSTQDPGHAESDFCSVARSWKHHPAFRKSVQYSFGGHLFSPGKSPCLTQLPDSLAGQEGTDGGWRAGSRACPCHSQGQALVALHCLLSQRELGGQREDHRPLQGGRLVFTLHGQRLRLL